MNKDLVETKPRRNFGFDFRVTKTENLVLYFVFMQNQMSWSTQKERAQWMALQLQKFIQESITVNYERKIGLFQLNINCLKHIS